MDCRSHAGKNEHNRESSDRETVLRSAFQRAFIHKIRRPTPEIILYIYYNAQYIRLLEICTTPTKTYSVASRSTESCWMHGMNLFPEPRFRTMSWDQGRPSTGSDHYPEYESRVLAALRRRVHRGDRVVVIGRGGTIPIAIP